MDTMETPAPHKGGRYVMVAAHRGDSRHAPENTMAAFRSALSLGVDMLELDLHMTKDGHLVVMHDPTLDRTTDGTGLVRDHTLCQIRRLDAGQWKGAAFRNERVPTFDAFLDLVSAYPKLHFNIELKDYPTPGCEAWAYESAAKALERMEAAGIAGRSVINAWSGKLLEHIDKTYGHRYRLHGYHPFFQMGELTRDPYDYLYCVCLFHVRRDAQGKRVKGEDPVSPAADFESALRRGVMPWVFYPAEDAQTMERALARGARLFTCNDPGAAIEILQGLGRREGEASL